MSSERRKRIVIGILLLCIFITTGCTKSESIAGQPQNEPAEQREEKILPEPTGNENNAQAAEEFPSEVGQLYDEAIFTPELISVSLEENEILKTWFQSPADFSSGYDLDQLYRQGICTVDISEQEVISFDERYVGEILPGLRIGDSVATVKDLLGEPQFADQELGYIGYRTAECYFAIEGNEKVSYERKK